MSKIMELEKRREDLCEKARVVIRAGNWPVLDDLRLQIIAIDEGIRAHKQALELGLEISDDQACRSGERWTGFEMEDLEEAMIRLVYDKAKKYGRSTLAIRYRLLEFIMMDPEISEVKLHTMVREIKLLPKSPKPPKADGSGSKLSKIRKVKAHRVLDELLDDVEVKVLALRRGIQDIKGV